MNCQTIKLCAACNWLVGNKCAKYQDPLAECAVAVAFGVSIGMEGFQVLPNERGRPEQSLIHRIVQFESASMPDYEWALTHETNSTTPTMATATLPTVV
jgi:hypothetical protein